MFWFSAYIFGCLVLGIVLGKHGLFNHMSMETEANSIFDGDDGFGRHDISDTVNYDDRHWEE